MPAAALTIALILADAGPAAEEIVVSATRRQSFRAEAPASIDVIGGETILRINPDHPAELLNRAPGVLIHRGSGQEHLTAIRSPVLTGGAGAGSFLYLEDGVPLRSAGFANVNELFEAHTEIAERIEVVRGPSGAFYGANAIHGVINVLTRSPSDELSYLAEIGGDTIGRVKFRGFVSDSFEKHGMLAAVSVLDDPGYRAESGVDQQKLSFRDDYDGGAFTASTVFAAYNLSQETAGFVEGQNAYLDPALRRGNPNPNSFRDARGVRLSSHIRSAVGEGAELSITPFVRWNEMAFRLHFFPSQAIETNSHWSVGAQNALYLDRGPIDAAIGFDAEFTKGDLTEIQSLPTVFSYTQGVHYDYGVSAVSMAPFANVTAELAPGLKANVAARLDYTRYRYDNRTASGIVGRFLRPDDRTDRFTTFSPKASLQYQLPEAMIYASYARGARPPQTSDLYRLQINQTTDDARPETIDAFELGLKGEAGLFTYEAAGYYMWKRHFFFRDADGYNVNNGRTRHVGGEARVTAALPADFFIEGEASYGRHTYRFSRPVLSLPQATEAIRFGDDVDTAPRWLAGVSARWAPNDMPIDAEISWSRVGRYWMDAANSVSYSGHDIVDARASYAISKSATATFGIRNILNSHYAERADYAFGAERYYPGEGRVASFSLRIES